MEPGENGKDMIETERLRLIPVEPGHLEALIQAEAKLGEVLGVSIETGWLVFPEVIEYSRNYLRENPGSSEWWMYFLVHTSDNRLIGSGGYKGAPDEHGMVEIGYAIAPGYEGRGLATEAAKGLVDSAFGDPKVNMVDAHTLAEENASCGVLKKFGMKMIAEKHDPDDGDIWQWRITREEYKKGR